MSKDKKQKVKGFKVTNPNMSCLDFKYELGQTYKISGEIKLCANGFHFCLQPQNCFNYYGFDVKNRVFEIEASGDIIHGDDKSVASEITLVREIEWQQVLTLVNTGVANSGYRNSGNRNSGNCNSGNCNSGNRNSGNCNSGNCNSGYRNSGNRNSGNRNSGDWNSGDWNSGNWNSGNCNSGNRNSGDCNSGYRNSGAFCTDTNPVIYLFDKPTNIKIRDWETSEIMAIVNKLEATIWVPASQMSDDEKAANPHYGVTDGYLKPISLHESWGRLWNNLSDSRKKLFTSLPNFDPHKFKAITGITI